jgi:hypothetical protein
MVETAFVASPVSVALAKAVAVVLMVPFVLDLPAAWPVGLVGGCRAREGEKAEGDCSYCCCSELSHVD